MNPAKPSVLTINRGSSSIKFVLFEIGDSFLRILEGGIERIGSPAATLRIQGLKLADTLKRAVAAADHASAVAR